MKSVVIYYSYSGNTRKVALALAEILSRKGETEVIELKALDESDKFFSQAARAFKHQKARLGPVNLDLANYDLICFGTPVWAFGPAPAMNTYLEKCYGLENKELILFTTYGSGLGNQRCLDYMQETLVNKGARDFKRFSLQQFKVKDKNFVLSGITPVLQQPAA